MEVFFTWTSDFQNSWDRHDPRQYITQPLLRIQSYGVWYGDKFNRSTSVSSKRLCKYSDSRNRHPWSRFHIHILLDVPWILGRTQGESSIDLDVLFRQFDSTCVHYCSIYKGKYLVIYGYRFTNPPPPAPQMECVAPIDRRWREARINRPLQSHCWTFTKRIFAQQAILAVPQYTVASESAGNIDTALGKCVTKFEENLSVF